MKKVLMKRVSALLAAVAAGVLLCTPSFAQGKREINVFMSGACSEYTRLNASKDYTRDLYGLYESQVRYVKSGPGLTVDYNQEVLDWLVVGGQFNLHRIEWEEYALIDGKNSRIHNTKNKVAVLPQVKFRIPSPRHFRLYAKVALGMTVNIGRYYTQDPVVFAWDLVPLGCEWGGQRVYGTAELAYGSVIRGGRIGIGFRF